MKILHLDFDDLKNPIGGGQAKVSFEVNRRLAKNHDITVVTSKYPGSRDETIEKIKFIRVGQENFPWNFLAFYLAIPKVVKSYPFDILIENFTPPISTTFSPLFTKKPVIGIAHWLFAKEMSQKYKLPFFIFENLGLKFYKNFIVFTQHQKKKILKINPKVNILVNSFGTELPKKSLKFKEQDYILFLGRIDIHQKGLDLLIKAFDQIGDRITTVLKIAGRGQDVPRLLKLIKKAKNKNKIFYIGEFNQEKENKLIGNSKFICLPSRYEMSPLVAKETLALEKPLIAFDIDGLRETVSEENAILIKPFDISAYTKGVLELLKNVQKRKKMGKEGRIRVKKFPSWDEVAKKQEEFYRKLLFK